jgi:hypothetical protein
MRGVDGFGHADDPSRRAGKGSNPAAGPACRTLAVKAELPEMA